MKKRILVVNVAKNIIPVTKAKIGMYIYKPAYQPRGYITRIGSYDSGVGSKIELTVFEPSRKERETITLRNSNEVLLYVEQTPRVNETSMSFIDGVLPPQYYADYLEENGVDVTSGYFLQLQKGTLYHREVRIDIVMRYKKEGHRV